MQPQPCFSPTDEAGRELARHGSDAFPVGCYLDDLSPGPVPWHWHEELELLQVQTGSMQLSAAGLQLTLGPGEGAFLNSGVTHRVARLGDGACVVPNLVFLPRLVGGGAGSVFWQNYLQPLLADPRRACVPLRPDGGWQSEALAAFAAVWQAMDRAAPGYEFRVRAALSEVVFALSAHASAGDAPPAHAVRGAARAKVMLQFIHDHYAEPLRVADIAASAAVSVSECLRCFHEALGETPNQYLRRHRVERAAELLCATALPVTEISAQCGFQDPGYFARTFRQLYGCAPAAYRRSAAMTGRLK